MNNNNNFQTKKVNTKISSILKKINTLNPFYSDLRESRKKQEIVFYNTNNLDAIKFDYSNIPEYDANFKPQGVTRVGDYVYVSAHGWGNSNSKLYVFNSDGGYEGYIKLDHNSHVGGITYDEENDILYVTGKDGDILAYDNRVITAAIDASRGNNGDDDNPCLIDLTNIEDRELNNDIAVSCHISIKDLGEAATTYYYDGVLYAATFNGIGEGKMRAFKTEVKYVNGQKLVDYVELYTTSMPTLAQGMAVTDYEGKRYLLVSQSMGPIADSRIQVYLFDENGNKELLGFHYCQPGIEGISVDEEGNVIGVNEFGEKISLNYTMYEMLNNFDKRNSLQDTLITVSGIGYEDFIHSTVSDDFQKTKEAFNEVGGSISNFSFANFDEIWNELKNDTGRLFSNLGELELNAFDTVKQVVSDSSPVIGSFVEELITTGKKDIANLNENVLVALGEGTELVANTLNDLGGKIYNGFISLFS